MRSLPAFCLPALCLLGAMSMTANAAPTHHSLNVQAVGAKGVVRMNGIPVQTFNFPGGPEATVKGTGGSIHALYSRNGDNEISVEVEITAPGGSVEVILVGDSFDDQIKLPKLEKNGTIRHRHSYSGYPEWSWSKADKVADGKAEVLKAVAEMHALFAKKDGAQVFARRKPYYDDLIAVGSLKPEQLKPVEQASTNIIARLTLLPLPASAELKVESFDDGRLWVVSNAKDYGAPIRLTEPGDPYATEYGQHWARFNGQWLMVR